MKYIILVLDGLADKKYETLDMKSPLEWADTPNIDSLSKHGICGKVQTILDGFEAGSDVGNLALLGYHEKWMHTGRGYFEALGSGIEIDDESWAFRVNLVGIDAKEVGETVDTVEGFEKYRLKSYGVSDISQEESEILLRDLEKYFQTKNKGEGSLLQLHNGKGFKHIAICRCSCSFEGSILKAPNTFLGESLNSNLPQIEGSDFLRKIVHSSIEIFKNHPINQKRIKEGKDTIDAIWLWGQGKSLGKESFLDRHGLRGSLISGVNIVKGLGIWAEMDTPIIQGATGDENTDYGEKVKGAISCIESGCDLVYLHIEATDELSHKNDLDGKIRAIEDVDRKVLKPVLEYFDNKKDDFTILITTDHYTYTNNGLHGNLPVPFLIYSSDDRFKGLKEESYINEMEFSEDTDSKLFFESGEKLIEYFLRQDKE